MSKYIGWLVVSQRTGYMLEGTGHAAKIFDTQAIARRNCKPLSDQVPVPIPYADVATALLKGSSFCFDTDDAYGKFFKCLRYDPSNKPFLEFSHDRNFVKWRFIPPTTVNDSVKVGNPDREISVPPAVASSAFNPDILVR